MRCLRLIAMFLAMAAFGGDGRAEPEAVVAPPPAPAIVLAPAPAAPPVYAEGLVKLKLLRSSNTGDADKVKIALERFRAAVGSTGAGPPTSGEQALLEHTDAAEAAMNDLDSQLQASGFKRKLVASGALNNTIEQATLTELREAAVLFRRAVGSTALGIFDGADLASLNQDEVALDTLAKFENHTYPDRDLKIVLPVGIVGTQEKDESDGSWTTYASADDAIKVDYFDNRGKSNTAISLAAMLLEKRKGLYFNTLDIAGDRFMIEASAQPAEGIRELVIFHGRERNGGVQGLGLRTRADPPANLTVPALTVFALPQGTMRARTLVLETPAQTHWRIVASAISNLLASDFQRLNGSRFISQQDCKGVKSQGAGVSKSVNIVFATARKRGVAMSDFVTSPIKDLFTSNQGSELYIGCIQVSVRNSGAIMASRELPAARSAKEVATGKAESSEEFVVTIPREPDVLPLIGKERLFFRSDEHQSLNAVERSLLFVHGYNNSFEDAVKRAAQIAAASDYPGYIYVFSWPSQGRYTSYAADMDYAEQGEVDLITFMKMILSTGVETKLDIIAHSMGSQILLRSLDGIKPMFDNRVGPANSGRVRLGQVIFAAPDVSTIVFNRKAARLLTFAERVTVYASANDGALDLSGWLRGSIQRVGAIGVSMQPAIVPGVHMIDVTGKLIPRYLVKRYYNRSHNTFAYDPDVLDDIKLILTQSAGSSARARWDPIRRSANSSWPGRFASKLYRDKGEFLRVRPFYALQIKNSKAETAAPAKVP